MKLVYINVTNSLNHKKMDNSAVVDAIVENIAEKMIGVDSNSPYIMDLNSNVNGYEITRKFTICVPDNISITKEMIDSINAKYANNTTHTVNVEV